MYTVRLVCLVNTLLERIQRLYHLQGYPYPMFNSYVDVTATTTIVNVEHDEDSDLCMCIKDHIIRLRVASKFRCYDYVKAQSADRIVDRLN